MLPLLNASKTISVSLIEDFQNLKIYSPLGVVYFLPVGIFRYFHSCVRGLWGCGRTESSAAFLITCCDFTQTLHGPQFLCVCKRMKERESTW